MPEEGHAIKSGKELERLVQKECVIRIERSPCKSYTDDKKFVPTIMPEQ